MKFINYLLLYLIDTSLKFAADATINDKLTRPSTDSLSPMREAITQNRFNSRGLEPPTFGFMLNAPFTNF